MQNRFEGQNVEYYGRPGGGAPNRINKDQNQTANYPQCINFHNWKIITTNKIKEEWRQAKSMFRIQIKILAILTLIIYHHSNKLEFHHLMIHTIDLIWVNLLEIQWGKGWCLVISNSKILQTLFDNNSKHIIMDFLQALMLHLVIKILRCNFKTEFLQTVPSFNLPRDTLDNLNTLKTTACTPNNVISPLHNYINSQYNK